MEKLFGLPINNLFYGLLVVLAIGIGILAISAFRNRVLFKTGIRNIARHPAQTSLIVLGLMLATLLISASLITGDTMNYSIKKTAIDALGPVDELVQVKNKNTRVNNMMGQASAQSLDANFSLKYFQKVQKALPKKLVDGVVPVLIEQSAAAAPKSRRNLPSINILGVQSNYLKEIAPLVSKNNKKFTVENLDNEEAFFNKDAAQKLELKTGSKVKIFIGQSTKTVKVAGIFNKSANPVDGPALIMPLKKVQKYFSLDSKISAILISNSGDALSGVKHSQEVVKKLKPVLKGTRLEVTQDKKEKLEEAEDAASSFSSIFLVFGQFSTIAGIMLIFLIFIMLAAERKIELGVLRALGSQSRDILRIFLFEGSVYAIMAAAVGSVLGIGVGYGMVKILAKAFGGNDFKLYYHFGLKSLVIAYMIGVIATLFVVFFSAWRAGHLNIVRAIKDLPEPQKKGRNIKRLIIAVLLVVFGFLLLISGLKTDQAGSYNTGLSFIIIGIPLLAHSFGIPERVTFSFSGILLLLLWLLPPEIINKILPWGKNLKQGIEMFFVSGLAIVTGAIWVVMYNSDLMLTAITRTFGRLKGLPPMLKIAVNYPMKNRFRTGLALSMFSLVVFTIIFMSIMIASFTPLYDDINGLSGGYDIQGNSGYASPVKNIKKAIDDKGKGISSKDFKSFGSFSMAGINIRQMDVKSKKWTHFLLQGIDNNYAQSTNYKIKLMDDKYKSSRQVWKALVNNPNLAVVHNNLVPAKTDYNVGEEPPDFRLKGFYRESKKLPDVYVQVKNPTTGKVRKLKVIGIIDDMALFAYGGIFTSQKTLNSVMKVDLPEIPSTPGPDQAMAIAERQMLASMPQTIPATTFWFKLKPGVNIKKASRALSKTFYKNGMETVIMKERITEFSEVQIMMNRLIQGFMGLGLIIGIAALGVIAARSVVERRRQIGMLRAIGFRKGMVQNTFILESGFISILGITIGVLLGILLSRTAINYMSKEMPGMVFTLPWQDVFVIAGLAYIASLITTFLPARQAAKVFPAEALRYE